VRTPGGVRLLGRAGNMLGECFEICVGVIGWKWCGFLWLMIEISGVLCEAGKIVRWFGEGDCCSAEKLQCYVPKKVDVQV
jgi:hypothetical protein